MERRPKDREFFGFDSNLHATFAGLPELVVPSAIPLSCLDNWVLPFSNLILVGQFISNRVEFIPVSLSIRAHRGTYAHMLT